MKFGISWRRLGTVVLTSTLVFTVSPATAWAQKKPKNDPAKTTLDPGTREIAKGAGTVAAVQGLNIKITDADKKDIFLVLQEQAGVHYTAQADPKWLAPGLFVRFSAPFDGSGRPTAPLKALEVFVPSQQPRMTPDQIRDQTPGIYPEAKGAPPGAKELFNDKDKAAAPKPAAQPPAAAGAQTYRIVGQLQGMRNATMMVNTGAQPVQIDLDPAVAINVTAQDLTFLQQGDEISYTGMTSSNQPDWVEVEKMDVKAPKKLTQATSTAKSRTRPGSKAKGGDPNDPAAADPDMDKPGQRPSSRNKRPAPGAKGANDKPGDKAADKPADKNAPK